MEIPWLWVLSASVITLFLGIIVGYVAGVITNRSDH